MNDALRTCFSQIRDENDLRSKITSVCAEIGKVSRLNILSGDEKSNRQYFCFLRLDSPKAQLEFQRRYEVNTFSDDLFFFADSPQRE
jgi:hypothetical protein